MIPLKSDFFAALLTPRRHGVRLYGERGAIGEGCSVEPVLTHHADYYEGFYEDTGCEFKGVVIARRCVDCPLSECRFVDERPAWEFVHKVKASVKPGDMETTAWVEQEAMRLNVSERTIYRRLKHGKMG